MLILKYNQNKTKYIEIETFYFETILKLKKGAVTLFTEVTG